MNKLQTLNQMKFKKLSYAAVSSRFVRSERIADKQVNHLKDGNSDNADNADNADIITIE
jgi:hypothetical protein